MALSLPALLAPNTAVGQSASENFIPPKPIDLAVELVPDASIDWGLDVTNNSDVAISDVKVRIDTGTQRVKLYPNTRIRFQRSRSAPPEGWNFVGGVLTIPTILPGKVVGFYIAHHPATRAGEFFPIRVSIISPKETPGFEYNNRAEVWSVATVSSLEPFEFTSVRMEASVDDLRPSLNGRAVFEVAAQNGVLRGAGGTSRELKKGVQVKITLTPGLSFASSMPSTTVSGNTAIWRVGDLPATGTTIRTLSVPVNLSGSAPLERRCLTAEVYQVTPPDPEDRKYDDVATVCLGDGPLELLGAWPRLDDDWGLPLISFFPCIDVTAYPCNADDTLELVAEVNLDDPYPATKQRRTDEAVDFELPGLDYMFLQPESVIIHVDDRLGRDVREGSAIWSTEDLMKLQDSQGRLAGNLVGVWDVRGDVTVTAPGGGDAPGRWVMAQDLGESDLTDVLDAPDSSKVTGIAFDTSDSDHDDLVYDTAIQFWALGTYVALYEITGTFSGTTYTDSGTYIFHVGPVAELEVRDAGANPEVASGKRAYTIEAVNNGPDAVSNAVVTLADVPEGVRVAASQGDYYEAFCGENGLCEGVWTIGELAAPETASVSGQSTSATLAIITNGDPITATIESARDYTVCIDDEAKDVAASTESACEAGGNSWHSAEYYDYTTSDCFDNAGEKVDVSSRSDCEATTGNTWYSNDTDVRIASQPGTGQGHPDVPQSLRVDKFGPLALLRWQAPESGQVNGLDVTHYQVERNGVMLAEAVGGTMYVDLHGGAVNQSYRVRAVNVFGVPGPWSLPAGAGGTLEQPEELGAPTGLTATPGSGVGRIDLSWFAPSEEQGLRYRIEHATDGAGPWRTLVGSQSGTTYSHTGLFSGTTHYYRVAALKGSVTSPWANVQATTEGLETHAPGWPMNLRFTSVDRTAVTLAWDPPVDDGGSPVTGYEYRVFGPCASGADAVCDVVAPTRVGGTTTTRRITGLNREGTYEFSVRALNAVGAGDWSQPITKDVGPETAGGGRVVLSPTRLTVTEGGEATYRVKLSRAPTMPLWVTMHWDGSGVDNLGGELPFQQFKILLPSGYDTSGLPEWCGGVRLDWNEAYAWNVGVPITVTAAEDEDSDSESLTILHSLDTVTHDCLGMSEEDWQPDPVYDGMHGIALQVTERDND